MDSLTITAGVLHISFKTTRSLAKTLEEFSMRSHALNNAFARWRTPRLPLRLGVSAWVRCRGGSWSTHCQRQYQVGIRTKWSEIGKVKEWKAHWFFKSRDKALHVSRPNVAFFTSLKQASFKAETGNKLQDKVWENISWFLWTSACHLFNYRSIQSVHRCSLKIFLWGWRDGPAGQSS